MKKRITLQGIAKTVNVTVATVHKALHNKKDVSPGRWEEILVLVRSMDYCSEPSVHKTYKVTVVSPGPTSDNRYFYQYIWEGIHDRTKELSSCYVEILGTIFDGGQEQQPQVLNHIWETQRQELSGLLTVVWNETDSLEVLNRFTDKGIQAFTISVDVPFNQRTACTMANLYRPGHLAAEYLGSVLRQPCRVVIIRTKYDANNRAQAVRGFFDQMMESNPLIEIAGLYENVYYLEKLFGTLSEFLHTIDNTMGIYASNARTTARVCAMISEIKHQNKVTIIGSELFEGSKDALKHEILSAIIDQNGHEQGYKGASIAFDSIVLGNEVPSEHEINTSLILEDNLPL